MEREFGWASSAAKDFVDFASRAVRLWRGVVWRVLLSSWELGVGENGFASGLTHERQAEESVTPAGLFVYKIMDCAAVALAVSRGLRELPGVLIWLEEENAPF